MLTRPAAHEAEAEVRKYFRGQGESYIVYEAEARHVKEQPNVYKL